MKIPALQYGDWHARWTSDAADNLAEQGTAVVRTVARTIERRQTSTCGPGDNTGTCEKPEGSTNTQTLPIVLGLVIPLTCAIVVFIYLHRRNNKKVAIEDMNDPHKSLDFGFDMNRPPPAKQKRGKKGSPEMIVTSFPNESDRKLRGLSLDMIESPYMLPPGLSGSGESLHSMTRSNRDQNDPYRPVIFSRSSSDTARSPHPWTENGSMRSGRSGLTGHSGFNDKSNLVVNAQRMSQTYPHRGASLSRTATHTSQETSPARAITNDEKVEVLPRSESPPPLEPKHSDSSPEPQFTPAAPSPYEEVTEYTSVLPSHSELPAEDYTPPPPPQAPAELSDYASDLPLRKDSAPKGLQINVNEEPLEDWGSHHQEEAPPPPPVVVEEPEDYGYDIDRSMIYTGRYSIDNSAPTQQQWSPSAENRASFLGLRPLPPDHPEENPEQRANRIRSFYKEYFDVTKAGPANAYYEDYDADYTDYADYGYYDGWFDPDSGQYYEAPGTPWAQPTARRAMTPPPRSAPRHDGGHDRHYSSMSGGRRPFRGPPPKMKKKLPPPKALSDLPTPHLLKSDSALFTASDFAPPTSFRQKQNGARPDSPMGGARPFSPAVKAYSPLASSFTGLSPIPSPYELRKSGTFTSLDFSPQIPRFRGQEGAGSRAGSDAGSIRSARSGISAMQMESIRSGAYRVSRIPKQFVTSREDLGNQLKPKWDLISPA